MDRHIAAFTLALLSGGLLATAQINAPDADGFIERARLMYENRNFNGAFDQSSFALKLSPDESQTEEAQFLRAQTLLREGSPSGLEAIDGFLAEFPASPKRVEMEKCGEITILVARLCPCA